VSTSPPTLASVTDGRFSARPSTSRNARLGAELEARLDRARNESASPSLERLVEAIGGPLTPEQKEANVTAAFVEETSYACAYCHHVFVDGDVVHRQRITEHDAWGAHWTLESVCEDCVRKWHPSWIEQRKVPTPCAGGCGVLVSHWHRDVCYDRPDGSWGTRPAITTCSRRCSAATKRVQVDARDCEVCGETFTPKRSDARYCSSACRQDAYRKRKLGATTSIEGSSAK
jgi:hypothetical protein